MTRFLGFPLLLLAAVLQTTMLTELRLGEGGLDLVLLLILSWTLLAGFEESFSWCLFGGILIDLLNGTPVGMTALVYAVMAFVVSTIFGKVSRNNLFMPPIITIVATLVFYTGMIIMLTLQSKAIPLVHTLIYVVLPTIAFNVLLSLPVFRLLGSTYDTSDEKGKGLKM